jgi:hypothetical protein
MNELKARPRDCQAALRNLYFRRKHIDNVIKSLEEFQRLRQKRTQSRSSFGDRRASVEAALQKCTKEPSRTGTAAEVRR